MSIKSTLLILLEEFRDTLARLTSLVPRTAAFPDAPNKIKVAIGMRRTGKTYFLYQYIQQLLEQNVAPTRILYLNLEDDRLLPINADKLAERIEAFYALYPENHTHKCYLFLDEIQQVEGWANVIRRLHDTKNIELFLTGSSAKLLSKEIATALRGRSLATEIWPYSFAEYQRAQNISIDTSLLGKRTRDQLTQLFQQYLKEGGFPEITTYAPEVRQQTLQDYVDVVIYRDIIERHTISNTALIKYMLLTMLRNVSSPFSINKFYNDVKSQGYKVSKTVLYDYTDYLEDAFLVFSVPLYSESLRKIQANPKKIYAIDTGILNSLSLEFTNNLGKLFENCIYLELRRQGYTVFYYLTEERYEIDFLIQSKHGKKKLLQVAWNTEDPQTLEREQRALNQAQKELNIPGEIITLESYLEKGLEPL